MSRWYPIASATLDIRDDLAHIYRIVRERARNYGTALELGAHCFDRLQIWCTTFDVDEHELDRALYQSPSLSNNVLEVLQAAASHLDQGRKAIPRYGYVGSGDIATLEVHLQLARHAIDMLFELSASLQDPAFRSEQPYPVTTGALSVINKQLNDAPLYDRRYSIHQEGHTRWGIFVAVHDDISARGTRWEMVRTYFQQILRLKDLETFSFVKNISVDILKSQSKHPVSTISLQQAEEYARTCQPIEYLFEVKRFELSLLAALHRIADGEESHLNLTLILPNGVTCNLEELERVILQFCKSIRTSYIARRGLIVTMMLVEANEYMAKPLKNLAANINSDHAVLGTVLLRVLSYEMTNSSTSVSLDILTGGRYDLAQAALRASALTSPATETASFSDEREPVLTIELLSPFTNIETLNLEFGRFGQVIFVQFDEEKENTAVVAYENLSDAETACITMHDSRFDGQTISVFFKDREPIKAPYISAASGELVRANISRE